MHRAGRHARGIAVLSEAMKLAGQIAALPVLAVQAAKRSILNACPVEAPLKYERDQFYALFDTEDQKEGMKAFSEKRRPSWKGR